MSVIAPSFHYYAARVLCRLVVVGVAAALASAFGSASVAGVVIVAVVLWASIRPLDAVVLRRTTVNVWIAGRRRARVPWADVQRIELRTLLPAQMKQLPELVQAEPRDGLHLVGRDGTATPLWPLRYIPGREVERSSEQARSRLADGLQRARRRKLDDSD